VSSGWASHEAGLGRLTPEREGWQGLGSEVDREDLHHREREWDQATGERTGEEGYDLGRGVHDRSRLALGACGSAEQQVACPEQQRAPAVVAAVITGHRDRLTGQRGEVHLDGPGQGAGVCRDPVPFGDHDDVRPDQLPCVDLARDAAPDDARLRG